jgi:sulfite reductase beta subunit-like hemoprotein
MAGRGGKRSTSFKPGQSGNPGGRPKALIEVQDLAREHTPAAISALVQIVTSGESDAARVAAASVILDRGWGKAAQRHDVNIKHSFVDALRELEHIAREQSAALGKSLAQEPDQPAPLRH